jgi:hypothetical protein
MVKMKISSDSKDQQISKLNKFFLVVNRIQKVGRDAQQRIDGLKNNKLNLSGNGGAPTP